ncbi:MAG: hypothetical protein A3G24_06650 [Betaproteobacteria bacterium RIFCSPLOWO2_12_FULL_62_13]|nr:MAG: hypothetical protein A3G24_06650 [Betaproteobacteria bacterium RIFCSPLOWO2_12_FULL_62_13]
MSGSIARDATLNNATEFFSPDYVTARARFRAAAETAGAVLHALALDAAGPGGEALTIDIARLGDPRARKVLLHTSGLHGVEAFAGSAIQLALLQQPPAPAADCALILVHVLNPYGMAWLRRANENNVDLNRNFLGDGETRSGAPDLYRRIDRFLNPPSPPASDFFYLQALWQALRHGFHPLKQAVAQGQYEFPCGVFFGGSTLQQGPRRYLDWLRQHLSGARYVFALDVHTGLGPWGEETLLPEPASGATPIARLAAALNRKLIEVTRGDTAAYVIRGGMGGMLPRVLPGATVDFVLQELGTYSPLAVFRALRDENRWHHYGSGGLEHPAKQRLREALCPAAREWRTQIVAKGIGLVHAAADWTFRKRER